MAKRNSKRDGAGGDAAKKASTKNGKTPQAPAAQNKVEQFKEYFDQSIVEMKKVTWPTRKEAVATSVAVFVLVIFMSLFLGVVDFSLSWAIEAILS